MCGIRTCPQSGHACRDRALRRSRAVRAGVRAGLARSSRHARGTSANTPRTHPDLHTRAEQHEHSKATTENANRSRTDRGTFAARSRWVRTAVRPVSRSTAVPASTGLTATRSPGSPRIATNKREHQAYKAVHGRTFLLLSDDVIQQQRACASFRDQERSNESKADNQWTTARSGATRPLTRIHVPRKKLTHTEATGPVEPMMYGQREHQYDPREPKAAAPRSRHRSCRRHERRTRARGNPVRPQCFSTGFPQVSTQPAGACA